MHAASAPLPLAAGLIPDAQLEWLDDVAHLPHLEGDSVTLDVIADFVDSLAGGG
jgi:pimeloyl-ACP methyl ester carboxylesterase